MSVAILGGGIAGLSAALNMDPRLSAVLLEREPEVGGLLKTDQKQSCFFDHGPHLFFHTDPYFLEVFRKATEICGSVIRPARTGQWSFKTLVDYPYAMNLFSMPDGVKEKCVHDFTQRQIANARRAPVEPRNYEQYCRTYFGDGLTDHFMIPYACKIWTVHPRDLTTEWAGVRIVLPDVKELIEGSARRRSAGGNYIKEFRYPKRGGSQAFVEGIKAQIGPHVDFRLSSRIVEVDLDRGSLVLADGGRIDYEAAISSLPLPELLKIVKDLPSSVKGALEKLNWFGVLLMNFSGVEVPPNPYQWIYFDQADACFHRIHYPSKLVDSMAPVGVTSIQAEASFSKFRQLPRPPEEMALLAWKQLGQLGFASSSEKPQVSFTREVDYAYAIMDHGRKAAVQHIRDFLSSKKFITCGRFGEWDYIWTDKVLNSGRNAALAVNRMIL